MAGILDRIGALFLQAVPTIILVLLFYAFLRSQFFGPLLKVMAERQARTEGARRAAEQSQAAAQEKIRAYQEALKKARAEIYVEQEAARRAAIEERTELIRQTRNRANDEIQAAKQVIAGEVARARAELEKESAALAKDIARVILSPRRQPPERSLAG
jgi:F-type H+-transporting ATPase subunit b